MLYAGRPINSAPSLPKPHGWPQPSREAALGVVPDPAAGQDRLVLPSGTGAEDLGAWALKSSAEEFEAGI